MNIKIGFFLIYLGDFERDEISKKLGVSLAASENPQSTPPLLLRNLLPHGGVLLTPLRQSYSPGREGERLANFLTPFGRRGWEIPGRRGALLPRHPEKSERLFSAFPDLPSSREGYPLFLKRQRGEKAEESLNFSLGAGGRSAPLPPGISHPLPSKEVKKSAKRSPLPLHNLLHGESPPNSPATELLSRSGGGSAWRTSWPPLEGGDGKSLEGGEHFSPPAPREKWKAFLSPLPSLSF